MVVISNSVTQFRYVAYNLLFKRTSTSLMFVVGISNSILLIMCLPVALQVLIDRFSVYVKNQVGPSLGIGRLTSSSITCGNHPTKG